MRTGLILSAALYTRAAGERYRRAHRLGRLDGAAVPALYPNASPYPTARRSRRDTAVAPPVPDQHRRLTSLRQLREQQTVPDPEADAYQDVAGTVYK